jgi:hypothetical protein
VHQQLDARAARVGEQVSVVRLRGAEHLHHAGEQSVSARAHVDGLDRQPHGVDTDHRSSSRIQLAHSAAAPLGQLTLIAVLPRRSSMRMSAGAAAIDGGSANGTNAGAACVTWGASPQDAGSIAPPLSPSPSHCATQRRSRFAFKPRLNATAAIDTPGWRHAAIASALNSGLWRRRRRRQPSASGAVVFTCPRRS